MPSLDVVRVGPEPDQADLVIVALHGRDQDADYMVEHLVDRIGRRGVSWLLPQAAARQWYAGRAGDPLADNERELAESLAAIDRVMADLPIERTMMVGFSQGGCVVAELVARRPKPFAGVAILTGTLLGPEPSRRTIAGRIDGLPVLLALGSGDPWMTLESADQTSGVLRDAGAMVDLIVTPSSEHEIHDADIRALTSSIDLFIEGTMP